MKYICKKDCYVRNPQGKLQHFKAETVVDYGEGIEVPEHFERADSGESGLTEKEEIMRKLKDMKVSFPASASLASLRRKLKEAEMK